MVDLAASSDGAGNELFHFLPNFPYFTHEECKQHQFLHVACEFTMIYGHGTYIHVTLPDVESQGANKTLECIYLSIIKFFKSNVNIRIRNLYLSMDNTVKGSADLFIYLFNLLTRKNFLFIATGNKCLETARGLAMLVALGICEKVKVTFGLVGHTKGECDGVMGLLQTGLGHRLFLTLESWKEAIIHYVRADSKKHFQVKDVDFLTLIPAYDKAFKDRFGNINTSIHGIARSQIWRFVTNASCRLKSTLMTYQEDPNQGGQLPR